MDLVNTQIGLNTAKHSASMINDKTFAASSLVGLSIGASQFSKSENYRTTEQVKNVEKSLHNVTQKLLFDSNDKRKVITDNADIDPIEETLSFSQSLSEITEWLQTNGTKISFSFESDNKNSATKPVVIVTDRESGNIIRQIPTEEVQRFAQRISELEAGGTSSVGLIMDEQA
jgi:uncharacterized FlaG/YvyC family protein